MASEHLTDSRQATVPSVEVAFVEVGPIIVLVMGGSVEVSQLVVPIVIVVASVEVVPTVASVEVRHFLKLVYSVRAASNFDNLVSLGSPFVEVVQWVVVEVVSLLAFDKQAIDQADQLAFGRQVVVIQLAIGIHTKAN